MQIELVGGEYSVESPSFWDIGPGGGGFDFGGGWDYVEEDWSRSAEQYSGDTWSGNFSVVEPGDRDVIAAGRRISGTNPSEAAQSVSNKSNAANNENSV